MIIYNYKKEFLGIDEKDLQALGFKSLQGLQREVNDFADLFVKTPGYIHNFKHVHWIDFITCAESNEESKVIINVNNKNFKATLQINTTYLVDSPASKAFIVHLTHLRELSVKESESISGDIVERQVPVAMAQPTTIITAGASTTVAQASEEVPVSVETKETTSQAQEEFTPLSLDVFDTTEETINVTEDPYETPLEVNFEEEIPEESLKLEEVFLEEDDLALDINLEEDDSDSFAKTQVPQTQTIQENFDNGYIYDPTVASDELGLPLDLIEEFIQDFVEQAKDFKDDLYAALDNADMDNLKILSHKLKGVAANLRIEDALEALTIANTSSDINIIRENLDTLYKIIAKLAGEEIVVAPLLEDDLLLDIEMPEEKEELPVEVTEEDLYSDPLEIDDVNVPEKIEIAQLADDTFEEAEKLTLAEDIEIDFEDEELPEEELQIAEESTLLPYDKEQVANDIGLDSESFQELFEDYISETQLLTATIQNAIESEDFTSCKNEALKLKGMSDNMRITSFTQEIQTLTNSSNVQELKDALASVKLALQTL